MPTPLPVVLTGSLLGLGGNAFLIVQECVSANSVSIPRDRKSGMLHVEKNDGLVPVSHKGRRARANFAQESIYFPD